MYMWQNDDRKTELSRQSDTVEKAKDRERETLALPIIVSSPLPPKVRNFLVLRVRFC
ncbi:unnamed protein product [Rhodiola kirilowii]